MTPRIRRIATAATLTSALLGLVSCGQVSRTGRAPSFLVIDSMQGASGASPDAFGTPLLSDVQTLITKTIGGVETQVPTIFNDLGKATVRIVLKDVGNPGATAGPSSLNSITINRYHIAYVRSDGRNVPGLDVPYPFDGALTATITNVPSDIGFEMVRHQAKEEPPLKGLATGTTGRSFIPISTIGYVTFYGRDLAGNDVAATGTISINFGDFADPD